MKLQLDLRDRIARCSFLFIRLTALGREIAFTPSLPDAWFDLRPGESLETRAAEVLTHHFRQLEKSDLPLARPERLSLDGDAWVAHLDLDVNTRQPTREEAEQQLAKLWDDTQLDGATELQRVGRCLDWLYPDELNRAVGRSPEVDELDRLLAAQDRRPIMLIGPPMTGKTTILHEVVYRRVRRRRKPHASKQNVWLLAPQRLISGMSFIGQWENRLLAILNHARQREQILYFNDLLGLYHAGQSSCSRLSVADVLKPRVQDREIRILGEMTPAAFHAFAERDRGFADLFHVIRIEETNDSQTLRILLAVLRQLEAENRCSFHVEALPAVIELHRRFLREYKFPGKAARFLKQLAVKHRRGTVMRQTVYDQFSARAGSPFLFLIRANGFVVPLCWRISDSA